MVIMLELAVALHVQPKKGRKKEKKRERCSYLLVRASCDQKEKKGKKKKKKGKKKGAPTLW